MWAPGIYRREEVKASDKWAVCAPGRLDNRVVVGVPTKAKTEKEELAAYIYCSKVGICAPYVGRQVAKE